jgi:hypothetical protein
MVVGWLLAGRRWFPWWWGVVRSRFRVHIPIVIFRLVEFSSGVVFASRIRQTVVIPEQARLSVPVIFAPRRFFIWTVRIEIISRPSFSVEWWFEPPISLRRRFFKG